MKSPSSGSGLRPENPASSSWKCPIRSSPYLQQRKTVRPCSLLRKSTSPSAAFTSTPSSATSLRMARSWSMIRTASPCRRWMVVGASGSICTPGPSIPRPSAVSFSCTPISSSRSWRALVNSSFKVVTRAFASRRENSRVGSGTSTAAPYRMSSGTESAARGSVRPMLRDLTGEERAAYFRGIQPIWGGGLSEDRFQAFQRRLADAPEAKDRYRLLGWFVDGTLTAAMKSYDLQGTCAGRPLRLFGVGAVYTPPELRRRGHAAAMLRAAMDAAKAQGANAAVLFSDIGVQYYERLGFWPLESRECAVDAVDLPRQAAGVRAAMAGDEPLMTRLFAEARENGRKFGLARDGWTLRFQLRRLRELARARGVGEPEWGLVAEGKFGEGAAMLRFGRDSVDVLEAAWTGAAAGERVLGGLRDCLQRGGRTRARFWPAGQFDGLFSAPERTSAIAMIAPLAPAAPVPERGAATDLALLDHI